MQRTTSTTSITVTNKNSKQKADYLKRLLKYRLWTRQNKDKRECAKENTE